MFSTQILIEVKVVKLHFEVNTKVHVVDIINMKVNLMEADKETLKEEEIMEVNNQMATQTTTTVR